MDKVQWSRMAMLSGRKMPTRSGNLLSCVRYFLALDEAKRKSARIVVPECIELDRGSSMRTLTGTAIATLASRLPSTGRITA